jgi:hypothetical protein
MKITSKVLGERGRKQGEALGHRPCPDPAGQYLTSKFPVLTYGRNPGRPASLVAVGLGEVERPYTLPGTSCCALPQAGGHGRQSTASPLEQARHAWTGVRRARPASSAQGQPEGRY